MATHPGLPVTWAELAALPRAHVADSFTRLRARIGDKAAMMLPFAMPFWSAVDFAAYATLVGEPVPTLTPLADAVLAAGPSAGVPARVGALAAFALAWLAGDDEPAGLGALAAGLLDPPATVEGLRRQSVWAILAYGPADAPAAVLLADVTGTPPKPGARFSANVHGTQVQIARAIAHGSPFADVAAAWEGYVAHFPRLLAAEQASWVELVLAARAVLARIGGLSGPAVLDRLRAPLAA